MFFRLCVRECVFWERERILNWIFDFFRYGFGCHVGEDFEGDTMGRIPYLSATVSMVYRFFFWFFGFLVFGFLGVCCVVCFSLRDYEKRSSVAATTMCGAEDIMKKHVPAFLSCRLLNKNNNNN